MEHGICNQLFHLFLTAKVQIAIPSALIADSSPGNEIGNTATIFLDLTRFS
jgi:hypothetical protein